MQCEESPRIQSVWGLLFMLCQVFPAIGGCDPTPSNVSGHTDGQPLERPDTTSNPLNPPFQGGVNSFASLKRRGSGRSGKFTRLWWADRATLQA
jgi:hypothetical protein